MQSSVTKQPRGCLATLAVFLVMSGILVGGFMAARVTALVPLGPINVGLGVHVTPAEGWEFGGRTEDGNTILLSRGNGSLAVTVIADQTALDALTALRNEWLASATVTASDIAPVMDVRSGALRFGYSGTFDDLAAKVEGEVHGIQGASGVTVVFDSWAGTGQYVGVRDDVVSMINTAVIP